MATGLPAHVASGELIASPWGNAVVDELTRLRTVGWGYFSHPGGTATLFGVYDNGQTNLGPFAYPVQVTVQWNTAFGYGSVKSWGGADIIRLSDGGQGPAVGNVFAYNASWAHVALGYVWNVPAGQNAGFKTRTSYMNVEATPNTFYFGATGIYFVHRYDTT